MRTLKAQLDEEAQQEVDDKRLRAELQIARQVNALRAESLADLVLPCVCALRGRASCANRAFLCIIPAIMPYCYM